MKSILKKYEEEQRVHVELEQFGDDSCLWQRVASGQRYDLIFINVILEQHWKRTCLENREWQQILDGYESRIVYVQFQGNQVLELYDRNVSGSVVSPIRKRRIFCLLDEIRKFHDNHLFSYVRERVVYQIPYSEILYFQSDGRKIEIHTICSEEPREYTGKLSQLLEQGLPAGFIAIHKSYIVNSEYIVRRSYEYVFLERRLLWLSVSQMHRKHVREVLEQRSVVRVSDEEAASEVLKQKF